MDNQIYLSHYMEFAKAYTGKQNKYGGVPTHLPPQWPVDKQGNKMAFLCQLYCDGEMLDIPDTLCIQLYQLVIDGEAASDPIVIQVPVGAKENIEKEGVCHEGLIEGGHQF